MRFASTCCAALCVAVALMAPPARATDSPPAAAEETGLAQRLLGVTGSRTKVVWLHCVAGDGKDWDGTVPDYELKAFDTADGKRRVIGPGPASYGFPWITPDGKQVVFTDMIDETKPVVKIMPFTGGVPRKLVDGFGLYVWRHPDDGSQWVIVSAEYQVKHPSPVRRHRIDAPSISEQVFVGPTSPRFRISADGRWAGGEFPHPNAGIANLEHNRVRQIGSGCNSMLAPDNSYRFFHMDGDHIEVTMFDAGGANRRVINVQPPGIKHQTWIPRWTNHARFFTITAPLDYAGTGGEVYIGRFDAEFTEVEQWVQVSDEPGTQSTYANAWIDLGIGQFSGEAPCRIEFEAPGTGDRQWNFGDGATATGGHVSHVYTEPGSYQVAARQGAKVVRGTVTVGPRIPPRLADVKVLDSTHVLLRFSERMSFDVASAAFGSGAVVVSFGPDPADDLGGIIITADPLPTNDTLTLSGLTDLAQEPSALEAVTVNISRAPWPSHCEGLVWLWETARADNVFWHPADRMQMRTELVLGGPGWLPPSTARFDRFGVLRTGRQCIANFRPGANDAIARGLTTGINADQRAVSIEMTITPDDLQQMPDHRLGAVISAMSWSFPNGVLHLAQKGDALQVAMPRRWGDPEPPIFPLATLKAAEPTHIVLATSADKKVACYVNGEQTTAFNAAPAGMIFMIPPVKLGYDIEDLPDNKKNFLWWQGRIEGVAIYNRFMGTDEAAANAKAYLEKIASRPQLTAIAAQAVLVATSTVPEPKHIAPYTRALAVFEYEVQQVGRGQFESDKLRVAHWVIMDNKKLPIASRQPGWTGRLVLNRCADRPDLESETTVDTLKEDSDMPLFVEADE